MILHDLDRLFEVDTARAFDEHDVARLHIDEEPATCGFGVGKKDGGDAAGAGCSGEMFRVAAHADGDIEAGFGGGLAACGVERGAMLAELKHFAGDKNAAACRARGEGTNHGAQCFGIGVVAVVEQGSPVNFDDLAALVAGGEGFKRGDGCVEIDSGFKSDGETGHGIGRVVRCRADAD